MQSFKSFTEEKQVTLTGGGKTVSLKPGQSVSFKHATSGKNVSGTFRKKKMMGGRQYAHVDMPDKTGMYVPVHHINEAVEVDEGAFSSGKLNPDAFPDLKNHVPATQTSTTRGKDEKGVYTHTVHKVNGKEVSSKKVYDKQKNEGYMHIGPADGSSPYDKFGDKKPGTKTLGNDSKREKRDMEPRSPVKKNINDRLTTTRDKD